MPTASRVRVHATLNTLVWDDELEAAERQARSLIDAGVDALIVQDMALRRMDLPVELHASTQVSNRTPEGARFSGRGGVRAGDPGQRNLHAGGDPGDLRRPLTAEVECFVHGAVCVGFSGRCFLSRSMSGRSGNRGRVQPALPAGVGPHRRKGPDVDRRAAPAVGARHEPVAPHRRSAGCGRHLFQDRRASERSRNYIRNVVAHYRRAVDEALAVRPGAGAVARRRERPGSHARPVEEFYARGVPTTFLAGKRAGVASFDTPKAVGAAGGARGEGVSGGGFVRSTVRHDLAPGDGICFI